MRNDIIKRKKEIIYWINQNKSKAFICCQLQCKPLTLNTYLKKLVIIYDGNQSGKGHEAINQRKPALDLCYYGSLISSHQLKNRLIRDGIKEKKCEKCGNTIWNNQLIPLELHHKDGNHYNNELTNLIILCPNCHAQEENNCKPKTHKLKKQKPIKIRKKIGICPICGKSIKTKSKTCEKCSHVVQRKIERPKYQELLNELKNSSFVAVGKKYGVSDNAIRKWIKFYEKSL